MNLTNQPLIVPLLAQVVLTCLIWLWMLATRYQSMLKHKVRLKDLASEKGYEKIKDSINPSDNFENLFEMPVLFFAFIITMMFTYRSDGVFLAGSWFFVITRALHSIIHCTSNHVPSRFAFHFMGSLVLFVMWFRFAIQIYQIR